MNKDLHHLSLSELSSMLQKKDISSVELTSYFLDRIDQHNKSLNAFIHIDKDVSLAEAKQADLLLQSGAPSPLTGIPIGQKDIFCTTTMPTTCASKTLKGFTATYNATLIEKCLNIGLVNLGKLNMDEFAMGSTNENSAYGPSYNPWNLKHCPGGSSGGSATAVAARIAPCATGTDTGGSVRQPAAFTGITGIKPTYGRISRSGMIAFASSLDQAGPLTYSAHDAALLLNEFCGHDPKDSTSSRLAVPDFTANINQSIEGMKIGIPEEFFSKTVLNAECELKIREAIQQLEKMGAKIIPIHLPNLKYAIPTYYLLAPIECASNLARFDGVHYGYRHDSCENIKDLYELSREYGFGNEVKKRILIGTFASSNEYSDEYYKQALNARNVIRRDYSRAFKEVDVILTPTTTSTAFELGNKSCTPEQMYFSDIYTVTVNLAGLPGMSIPVGFSEQGLPVGMQLIGNRFCEDKILQVAHKFQCETEWHTLCPEQFK